MRLVEDEDVGLPKLLGWPRLESCGGRRRVVQADSHSQPGLVRLVPLAPRTRRGSRLRSYRAPQPRKTQHGRGR